MARRTRPAEFAEWLDITLENRGVSGRTLADQIGVHENAVSRWRSGTSTPTSDNVAKMARVLDLDARRLALTAGVLAPEFAPDVEPYPMPEPTAQRESVRRQIARIKGLSEDGHKALLEAYDKMIMEAEQDR